MMSRVARAVVATAGLLAFVVGTAETCEPEAPGPTTGETSYHLDFNWDRVAFAYTLETNHGHVVWSTKVRGGSRHIRFSAKGYWSVTVTGQRPDRDARGHVISGALIMCHATYDGGPHDGGTVYPNGYAHKGYKALPGEIIC